MEPYRTFIEETARKAGALLREKIDESHTVDYKGEINLVTEADRLSEALILKRIGSAYPDHDILAEESPERSSGSNFRWIIDPLDGTTNYAHGYPFFCVSIALEARGEILLGCVYNPMLDELFIAERGSGAFLNGRRLRVSQTADLSHSLVATGFPYDLRRDPNNNINYFEAMTLHAQALRRTGAAALDLAHVAAGRLDGFWQMKLMPWDVAAGWLLVMEAGGVVTDLQGAPFHLRSPHIIAATPRIHPEISRLLAGIDPLYRFGD